MSQSKEEQRVYSSNGNEFGILSGSQHRCKIEGCKGARMSTVWPDGKRTFPCSEGLKHRPDGHLQIA